MVGSSLDVTQISRSNRRAKNQRMGQPGKMLKAIRIMDRQYGGKLLRYFFNGFGYQLRLAEANRKMMELTLPELRPTKRIKANPKKGLPARLSIDPRTRDAHSSNRRLKRASDALDQNLLPLLLSHNKKLPMSTYQAPHLMRKGTWLHTRKTGGDGKSRTHQRTRPSH